MTEKLSGFVVGYRAWSVRVTGDALWLAAASVGSSSWAVGRGQRASCSGSATCYTEAQRVRATVTGEQYTGTWTTSIEWDHDGDGRVVARVTATNGTATHVETVKDGYQFQYRVAQTKRDLTTRLSRATTARVNNAVRRSARKAPTKDCSCGWHALHNLDKALACQANVHGVVRGAVLGWGRVVIHDLGWRAEYARPVALIADPKLSWTLGVLGERYGVPVVAPAYVEAVAREFGSEAKA